MKICIIGRTKPLLETAKFLNKKNHKIGMIITSEPSEYDSVSSKDFRNIARSIDAKFVETQQINQKKIQSTIKNHDFDLGISLNNLRLLDKKTLSLFKYGVLNCHFGDLPHYRGNACPNWAMLNGEKKIGISIHLMDEGVDSGNIIIKKYFPVNKKTAIQEFYNYAEEIVPTLFLRAITNIKNSKHGKKQSRNPKQILRTYPRNKFDGKIDWNDTADHISRLIRASGKPFYGAYTFYNSKKLFVLESSIEHPKFNYESVNGQVVERRINGDVVVSCLDGFLILSKVKYNGKIYAKPTTLIKTIHSRLGMNIEEEIEQIKKHLKI
jgi:methionyl-tRNA formyltransferase